ncbi:hypothetical protein JTB14_017192 [Gonioctena quinquepunctata]|nr:hypothetical protein JTB14_017192 [Gonioctena quinquepunctata]
MINTQRQVANKLVESRHDRRKFQEVTKMSKRRASAVFTIEDYNSTTTLAKNDQIKMSFEDGLSSSVEKVYCPYENRTLEHPNTVFGAFIHLVKSSLGSGILSMPRAFKSAGLVVGLLGTILVGFLSTHTIYILVSIV